jgi:hypothetical protein
VLLLDDMGILIALATRWRNAPRAFAGTPRLVRWQPLLVRIGGHEDREIIPPS